jgi:hypothetical protein
MLTFDWSKAEALLQDFGGKRETFYVQKTGLPFFDVLRLYGAIDLYIGLREDIAIKDNGNEWEVTGAARQHHITKRDETAFLIWKNNIAKAEKYCKQLRAYLREKQPFEDGKDVFVKAEKEFVGLDAVLQTGIRGVSAYTYETLQTGQTSKVECKVEIPLSQGLLAFAGKKRCEAIARILFLPIFEGRVDFTKVVSPLRFWIGPPNIICAQALILLALKTSLFSEGYADRLSAVVYNTDFDSRKNYNCSGIISIKSTAVNRINSVHLAGQIYRTFRRIVENAWRKDRRPNSPMPEDALSMAYWLMQPVAKHLTSMITSQERLRANGHQHIFTDHEYVKEVFIMSYGEWNQDFESVHKLAKAVASAIYFARQSKANKEEKGKAWYDEVVMLRSAPTPKAFIERVLILLEQGHKEHGQVGTIHRDEIFDPSDLYKSIGKDRRDFETFRDLFRMYLIQESTYKAKDEPDVQTPEIDKNKTDTLENEMEEKQ